jgi:hypothetical protein
MKNANYETFAAFHQIVATGGLESLGSIPADKLAKILRRMFLNRHPRLMEDKILGSLNPRRINFRAVACCLSDRAQSKKPLSLDLWCNQ